MFLHLPTRWKPRRLVAKRMRWELLGGPAHGTRGLDTFTVLNDRIVDQHVQLHTPDY